jgi:hypothetical protein
MAMARLAQLRDAGNLMLGMAAATKDPKQKVKHLAKALEAFAHPQARHIWHMGE